MPRKATGQRAVRAFWGLVVTAALAMGALSTALTNKPGPLTGLLVAASGATVLVSLALAGRVMIALGRARQGRPSARRTRITTRPGGVTVRTVSGRRGFWTG